MLHCEGKGTSTSPHPLPKRHPLPCSSDKAAPARAASRQGGRGREEGVRCQQTGSLFYTEYLTSVVAPSETKTDG